MPTIQKFMFDTAFDEFGRRLPSLAEPEPEPEPEEPEAPPEPTVTLTERELEAKLAAARAEGHAAGHKQGVADGRQAAETEVAKALMDMLGRVEAGLKRILSAEPEARRRQMELARGMALAINRKLFPILARTDGYSEVEGMIRSFLTELSDEPKLIIKVHERWLEPLRDRIGDMAIRLGFGGHLTVLADPRLGEMDVRADWGDGGAERDITTLWGDVERIAGVLIPGASGAPQPQPPTTPPMTAAPVAYG